MLIHVLYKNGTFDMVKPHLLDRLVELKQLNMFLRSNGWVSVWTDPIRGRGGGEYDGKERRSIH